MASTFTQAHEFFNIHAVPNMEAWLNQPTDIRLAMNAIVSLYQLADYFWHVYASVDPSRVFFMADAGQFRAELARRNIYFSVLRDIAEAHKHMKLRRRSRVTEADQTAGGAAGFGDSGFGTGPFDGGPSIVVKLDDHSVHHVSYIAEEVRQLWLSMLT